MKEEEKNMKKVTSNYEDFIEEKNTHNRLRIQDVYRRNGSLTESLDFDYDDLEELLTYYQEKEMWLRSLLGQKEIAAKKVFIEKKEKGVFFEDKEKIDSKMFKEIQESSVVELPVSITYNKEIMIVKTPLTFKRKWVMSKMKNNYMLANQLKYALKKWQNEHGSLYNSLNPPYILLMKRVDVSFNIYKICDNDNLENSRIINVMTQALGLNDNAIEMDLISTFKLTDNPNEVGSEFYIFEKKNLKKYLYLIEDNQKKLTL